MKATKDQLRRFKEAAKESGADESGAEFERAFAKIVPAKTGDKPKPATKPRLKSRSR